MAPSSTLLAATALLAMLLASSLDATSASPEHCPRSCASAPGDRHLMGSSSARFDSSNPSECRRICYSKGMVFYEYQVFSSDGKESCNCFSSCESVVVNPSLPPVVLGYAPSCADIECPLRCSAQESTLITSPKPLYVTGQKNAKECREFCTQAGLSYYQQSQEGSCSCFVGCAAANTRLGMAPVSLGFIPACKET